MDKITLGILGGGQLGKMSALAAARLGIECVIYSPDAHAPACQVVRNYVAGEYRDKSKLLEFSEKVDVISYEFENIPLETARYLNTLKPVFPDPYLLEISQDRIAEKKALQNTGIPTTPWYTIQSVSDMDQVLKAKPKQYFILKMARFGYDGKGQISLSPDDDPASQFAALNSDYCILEERVDFQFEISVIIARDQFGQTAFYGPTRNEHENHILKRSVYPAGLESGQEAEALTVAQNMADKLDLRGVLAVEMFMTSCSSILVNEIAPRPHNSGHWTIDACTVSQFENHVRTVCGLPLGDPAPHSAAEMINLIGDEIRETDRYLKEPATAVHIYGKDKARAGRKMGHVTRIQKL